MLENHDENSNNKALEQGSVGHQAGIFMESQFEFVHETRSMVLGEPSERGFLLKAMLSLYLEIFQLHELVVSGQVAQVRNHC